ncbi:hypothetical protein [Vibrio phage BONAISHI]|nr:hypothetical protein [Vibrio phage BONAISHI]
MAEESDSDKGMEDMITQGNQLMHELKEAGERFNDLLWKSNLTLEEKTQSLKNTSFCTHITQELSKVITYELSTGAFVKMLKEKRPEYADTPYMAITIDKYIEYVNSSKFALVMAESMLPRRIARVARDELLIATETAKEVRKT